MKWNSEDYYYKLRYADHLHESWQKEYDSLGKTVYLPCQTGSE